MDKFRGSRVVIHFKELRRSAHPSPFRNGLPMNNTIATDTIPARGKISVPFAGFARTRNAMTIARHWILLSTYLLAITFAATTTVSAARPRATYVVKPTQIPGLLAIDGQALEELAKPYIAAVIGSVPRPFTIVEYPASAFPLTGLLSPTADQSQAIGRAELAKKVTGDPEPVIFGYSQGASVISLYKRDFNALHAK